MPSPISAMTEAAGDTVYLQTPAQAATPYDPNSTTAFVPGATPSPGQPFRGCIADKKMRQGMPAEATTAFTISTTSKPANLQPMKSHLLWKGIVYLIVDYRVREYRGEIDGYTLFLRA